MRIRSFTFTRLVITCICGAALVICAACGLGTRFSQGPGRPGEVIADHQVALEESLRYIPESFINKAKAELHVAYQHTSHGYQVSFGLYGLQDYKSADAALFGVSNNAQSPEPGKLDFHDNAIGEPPDLSNGVDSREDGQPLFVIGTRAFLDAPENKDINVVMWSWCSISGHNVANYLEGMDTLISEYGPNGSRGRPVPVTFIFMTGHAEGENIGEGRPKNQADLILAHCREGGYFCLDYFGIETHDMEGNYHPAANDDGYDTESGETFFLDWQERHSPGSAWYENKNYPGGEVEFGPHNSQHITANRKAYAMWWILARIAGWDGN